ncbi:MAG: holo-[acyl-carrier protein] synthase [Chloroflexi bacterium]|jgi:holo-[acyl-carrier protein] synthase|nr:MAG: holo-[acyl-carrier protein] synthase [Chloroflexota bacterium]
MLITGIDIIEIARIENVLNKYGIRFLNRIYTESEQKYCRGRAAQLASRFAAKEAVMKALGTGVRGVGWKDIEIKRDRGGPPYIQLHGRGQVRASKMGLSNISLSLSHSNDFAVASVVGEAERGNRVTR